MNFKAFRDSPLSNPIINALVSAVNAQSKWQTLLSLRTPNDVLTDLLTIEELYYHSFHKGSCPDFEKVLRSYYSTQRVSDTSKEYQTLQECTLYAKHRISQNQVLTAADLLKINEVLTTLNAAQLADENIPYHILINDIWTILLDLYNPCKSCPVLLEIIIAVCRLLTLPPVLKINLWTLYVLLETMYPEIFKNTRLSLQWLLLVNPEEPLADYEPERLVLLLLEVFKNMWEDMYNTHFDLIDKEKDIQNIICGFSPSLQTDRVLSVLTSNICLSNKSFGEKAKVSHGTSVNYLKELERIGVLYSVMDGRERLYFNKAFCKFASKRLGVT